MLDILDMPDGVCEYSERTFVIGVELAVEHERASIVSERRGALRDLLGDVAMNEDVARGRGRDDAFRDTGIGTSNPEKLRACGTTMQREKAKTYLGVLALG